MYGVKLTEMHLDDWTIARLLGHSSLKNVKYYRKMSNQTLRMKQEQPGTENISEDLECLDGWEGRNMNKYDRMIALNKQASDVQRSQSQPDGEIDPRWWDEVGE